MIYLKNTPSKQQSVKIPTASPLAGAIVVTLFSTVERREVLQVAGTAGAKRLYVEVAVTLPKGLADGEYEYQVKAGKAVTDTGVAVIGDYVGEKQYKESFEYKQYGEEGRD